MGLGVGRGVGMGVDMGMGTGVGMGMGTGVRFLAFRLSEKAQARTWPLAAPLGVLRVRRGSRAA